MSLDNQNTQREKNFEKSQPQSSKSSKHTRLALGTQNIPNTFQSKNFVNPDLNKPRHTRNNHSHTRTVQHVTINPIHQTPTSNPPPKTHRSTAEQQPPNLENSTEPQNPNPATKSKSETIKTTPTKTTSQITKQAPETTEEDSKGRRVGHLRTTPGIGTGERGSRRAAEEEGNRKWGGEGCVVVLINWKRINSVVCV